MENNYTLDAEILTEGGEGRKFDFDCQTLAGQVCSAVLTEEKCPYDTDVFLLVADEEEVHRMNLEYRGIDRTTDVLSFPAVDFPAEADFSSVKENEADYLDPETGRLQLGDIVINASRVWEQAAEYGHRPCLSPLLGFHGLLMPFLTVRHAKPKVGDNQYH